MSRLMSRWMVLLCVLSLLVLTCGAQQAPQKKKVAVFDFDYGTVRSSVAAIWGTDQDVGKGIADLLVQKLLQDGKYRVIERKALDKILAEQNFSNSDRADPTTAARLGKVLGVDAIIIGSITQFGRDDKSTTVGGIGAVTGRFGLGGVSKKEAKAVVNITARLVDTSTAEILASVTGNGQSKRSGTSLVGAGGGPGGFGAGGLDMSSKNFGATILGEAVGQAVDSAGSQLGDAAGKLPESTRDPVSGLVADASGDILIINIGSKNGIRVGDKLEISRPGKKVMDPAHPGKVLKTMTSKIGQATVTEVDTDSATVSYQGSVPAKVGDVAKTIQ